MTLLIYGDKASRTHENQMLQVFLGQLDVRAEVELSHRAA